MLDYYDFDAESDGLLESADQLIWDEADPLATRLRTMAWTTASTDVRERCWTEIKRRIETLDSERVVNGSEPGPDVNCDRYHYSRRGAARRISSAEPRRSLSAPARHFRPRTLAWAFR
jgi:hypothetical protein